MTLKVIFGVKKTVRKYNMWYGVDERTVWELKTIYHECDESKSAWENQSDAFAKAVSFGHDPHQQIRMSVVA